MIYDLLYDINSHLVNEIYNVLQTWRVADQGWVRCALFCLAYIAHHKLLQSKDKPIVSKGWLPSEEPEGGALNGKF
jgi:hypothetical protein